MLAADEDEESFCSGPDPPSSILFATSHKLSNFHKSSSAKPNGNCSEVSTEFCPRIESNCQLKTLFMSTTLALSIPRQRFLLDFFYVPSAISQ